MTLLIYNNNAQLAGLLFVQPLCGAFNWHVYTHILRPLYILSALDSVGRRGGSQARLCGLAAYT